MEGTDFNLQVVKSEMTFLLFAAAVGAIYRYSKSHRKFHNDWALSTGKGLGE